jgi:hypothetical protein
MTSRHGRSDFRRIEREHGKAEKRRQREQRRLTASQNAKATKSQGDARSTDQA